METATLVMDPYQHDHARPTSHRHRHGEPEPYRPTDEAWLPPSSPVPARRDLGDHPADLGVRIRTTIATRLLRANFELARAAWARRRSDRIGPHATIYLYAGYRSDLQVAYRTFVAADEPSLPHLLHQLIPHVRAQLADGRDIREVQCTVVEDSMRADATYLGVAAASLDTPAASWDEVCRTAYSEQHIPGRSYAWLVDDTVMVIDRFARDQFARVTVSSNRPVSLPTGAPGTFVPDLGVPDQQTIADPHVLAYLQELNHTVLGGDTRHTPVGWPPCPLTGG